MSMLKTLTLLAALVLGITTQASAVVFDITFNDANVNVGSGQIDVELANNIYYAASGSLTVTAGQAIGNWNLYTKGGYTSFPNYFTSPAGAYWYNNAVYVTGQNPQYTNANPLLDEYGLLFTQNNTNELNLWGNVDGTYTLAGNIGGWQNFNVTIRVGGTTITPNPAPASKLVFTTTAVSVTAGTASGTITVQRQDQYGNPNTTDANCSVTLSSDSSGTATFSLASPLTIAYGSSSASFTYTDTKAGNPTITAASSPLTSATQVETVNTGTTSGSQSTLTASPTSVTADGSTTSTITVTLEDAYDNPVAGKAVSLTMTSGTGTPTITTIAGTTDANGHGSWTVKSTTAGVDAFTALDSSDNITVTQPATVMFIHCAAGDVTAAPAWYIDTNNRIVITLCDSYGLRTVQALRLTNCTMTAQAYNATGSALGSAMSLTDPDHGGGYVPLPNGTVKVVCLASLISGYTTGSCNAQAQDMCGLFSATADPVITQLTIARGGETQQILTGIPSPERLIRVRNGTPGLTKLTLVVNGHSYVLAPLSDGASLSQDVGAAMNPGDGNTIVLLGEGAEGASAAVTLGDSPVGDPMIAFNTIALQIAGSAQGVQLSWPATASTAGYLLQSRPSLAPSDAWVNWPVAPENVNGRWDLTVPAEGSARLFRLYKP
jgi:hypothetical protein